MKIKRIHLEPTNKCTLKCPRCARTEFIDQFGIKKWTNKDLDLEAFKNFLDIDISGVNFLLCGNYGDPIYYDNLFELIDWLKQRDATITMATNGSYKSKEWWQELTGKLDKRDKIGFSVDGIPDNFTQYRINADWASIETGIKIAAASEATTSWKYIPFSFNENDIEKARQLSIELGFDRFDIMPSDRWKINDPLKPVSFYSKKDKIVVDWKLSNNRVIEIDPKCHNNNEHFISADGFYAPCCRIADHRFYYKSKFYKNKENYDISKTTFTQVLEQEQEFFDTLKEAKLPYCTFNCPKI